MPQSKNSPTIRSLLTGLFFLLTAVVPSTEGFLPAQELPAGIDLELPPAPGPGPAYLPRHGSAEFLSQVRDQAKSDPASAGERLIDWIRKREGRLIQNGPLKIAQDPEKTAWIAPPEVQLHQWALDLPANFLSDVFHKMPDLPLDGAHPWIWAPGLESAALEALEVAVESGDRQTASLLLRRRGLASRIPAEWQAWIFQHEPPETGSFSTTDRRLSHSSSRLGNRKGDWQVHPWNLEVPTTVEDPKRGATSITNPTRRSALSRIHGVVRDQITVLADDRRIRAFHPDGRVLW